MNIGLEFDSVLLFGQKGLLVNVYWDFLHYNADWRDLAVLYQNHFTWPCAAAGFTCRAELDDFLWSAITTWAQKLLERFNLTYFYCSNKQSGCSQMQKMLLNNWSLRLIWWNIMIWEDTWTMAALHPVMTVTRMFVAVVKTDPNRRTLMCMQFFTNLLNVKWNKPKTKDGVYPCTNTHTHTHVRERTRSIELPTWAITPQQAQVLGLVSWLMSGFAATVFVMKHNVVLSDTQLKYETEVERAANKTDFS